MRPIETEGWALRILDSVKAGAFVEDSLVELKAEWPDCAKAARQIAGHANAARGSEILWLIGVDEKRGVLGVAFSELSTWHAKLETYFDGVAPALTVHLNIPYDNATVTALVFESERAPFVVRNEDHNKPNGSKVSFEVPWREGARTRSARRADLVRLLVPLQAQPTLEALEFSLTLDVRKSQAAVTKRLQLSTTLYITPRSERVIVFPYHRIAAKVAAFGEDWNISFRDFRFVDGSKSSAYSVSLAGIHKPPPVTVRGQFEMMEITLSEIVFWGPRSLKIYATAQLGDKSIENSAELNFALKLDEASESASCSLSLRCRRSVGADGIIRWKAR